MTKLKISYLSIFVISILSQTINEEAQARSSRRILRATENPRCTITATSESFTARLEALRKKVAAEQTRNCSFLKRAGRILNISACPPISQSSPLAVQLAQESRIFQEEQQRLRAQFTARSSNGGQNPAQLQQSSDACGTMKSSLSRIERTNLHHMRSMLTDTQIQITRAAGIPDIQLACFCKPIRNQTPAHRRSH